jgi:hypothetical protein
MMTTEGQGRRAGGRRSDGWQRSASPTIKGGRLGCRGGKKAAKRSLEPSWRAQDMAKAVFYLIAIGCYRLLVVFCRIGSGFYRLATGCYRMNDSGQTGFYRILPLEPS